jgi:hypothetical protein
VNDPLEVAPTPQPCESLKSMPKSPLGPVPKRFDSRVSANLSTADGCSTCGEDLISAASSTSWIVHSPLRSPSRKFTGKHELAGAKSVPISFQKGLLTPSFLTPNKLRKKGVLVHNTFLHIDELPSTPVGLNLRANSVPRGLKENLCDLGLQVHADQNHI